MSHCMCVCVSVLCATPRLEICIISGPPSASYCSHFCPPPFQFASFALLFLEGYTCFLIAVPPPRHTHTNTQSHTLTLSCTCATFECCALYFRIRKCNLFLPCFTFALPLLATDADPPLPSLLSPFPPCQLPLLAKNAIMKWLPLDLPHWTATDPSA